MIYETEDPGTEKAFGQHAATVIQTCWYAACCFCNASNYSRGVFFKRVQFGIWALLEGKAENDRKETRGERMI